MGNIKKIQGIVNSQIAGNAAISEGKLALTYTTAALWQLISDQADMISLLQAALANAGTTGDVVNYEDLSSQINDSRTSFNTTYPYKPGTLVLVIRGLYQIKGTNFAEVTPASGLFLTLDTPLASEHVPMIVQYVRSSDVPL